MQLKRGHFVERGRAARVECTCEYTDQHDTRTGQSEFCIFKCAFATCQYRDKRDQKPYDAFDTRRFGPRVTSYRIREQPESMADLCADEQQRWKLKASWSQHRGRALAAEAHVGSRVAKRPNEELNRTRRTCEVSTHGDDHRGLCAYSRSAGNRSRAWIAGGSRAGIRLRVCAGRFSQARSRRGRAGTVNQRRNRGY